LERRQKSPSLNNTLFLRLRQMERREIKYGKAPDKDKQIGKVRELEKDEEKEGRPE